MICELWDIVVVPFPFVDSAKVKPRPALVLSNEAFNSNNGHTIMSMITTGSNRSWYSDVVITELEKTGLNVSSVVRPKIFTLDNRFIKKKIGHLSSKDVRQIKKFLEATLFI